MSIVQKKCAACGKALPLTEQNKHGDVWYCNTDIKPIKAKAAQEAEEETQRKAEAKLQKEKERRELEASRPKPVAVVSPVTESVAKADFDALKSQFDLLKEMVSKVLSSAPQSVPPLSVMPAQAMLDLAQFTYDDFIDQQLIAHDLKKFDVFVTATHGNFFFNMQNIQRTPEIYNDPQKYEIARLMNRHKRGDDAMYKIVFKLMKEKLMALVHV